MRHKITLELEDDGDYDAMIGALIGLGAENIQDEPLEEPDED